jgi:epoxyqueuosine reductase
MSLTQECKEVALANGADLAGVVKAANLPEHSESLAKILAGADSVIVLAVGHNLAALANDNTQVMQVETAFTYAEATRAAKSVERYLARKGYSAVAVPPFLPVDMAEPKYGLKGEICWRRAAVRAGLGSYGMNGLLVTSRFGSAVRLSGVVTTADLTPDEPLSEDVCTHCGLCLEACPAKALSGDGPVNKRLCGPKALEFGFNKFRSILEKVATGSDKEKRELLDDYSLRELWQTFITGSYYYCAHCLTQCPLGDHAEQEIGKSR